MGDDDCHIKFLWESPLYLVMDERILIFTGSPEKKKLLGRHLNLIIGRWFFRPNHNQNFYENI